MLRSQIQYRGSRKPRRCPVLPLQLLDTLHTLARPFLELHFRRLVHLPAIHRLPRVNESTLWGVHLYRGPVRLRLSALRVWFTPTSACDRGKVCEQVEGFRADRLSAPANLTALVEAGKFGTKTGSGFLELEPEKLVALIDYRNKAYKKMQELLDELGPSPLA